ncbi:hypothetical protein [Moraxella osloensis]|uniref:hypothetical protein n=1 Tax=Faucicola osloensis TaxID=34062 RepID=UPI0011AE3451|nr:hypothetical protein [Moraxella osloensis]
MVGCLRFIKDSMLFDSRAKHSIKMVKCAFTIGGSIVDAVIADLCYFVLRDFLLRDFVLDEAWHSS